MLAAFSSITTFVFDVDGVLTDGTLLLLPDGEMARNMNIKDGYALQLAVKQGYTVIIISGGISSLVEERLRKLGIKDVYMGVQDKKKTLFDLLKQKNIDKSTVLFMGDDVPDIEAMQACGLPCCPADACNDTIAISRYISPLKGGYGCGRDVIEKVLKLQGKWNPFLGISSR